MAEAKAVHRAAPRPTSWLARDWRLFGAVILLYLMLLPTPFNITIGPLLLPPFRIFVGLTVLIILTDLIRGNLRLRLPDYLILLLAAWIAASTIFTMGLNAAFQASGSLILDIVLAYFWFRTALKTIRDVRLFLVFAAPGLALTGLLIAAESLSGSHIVIPLASSITGNEQYFSPATRLGLLRAPGPFPHPILAGIFLGSFLPLYLLSGLRGWPKLLGIAGASCCVFTMSSGALLVLAAGLGLTIANWAIERTELLKWRVVLLAIFGLIVVIEVGTQSGTVGLITRFAALNPETAFFRLLIWEEGTNTVRSNPIFGIGFNDWVRPSWMPPSVDNYWLLLAMRHGLLAPIAILLVVVASSYMLSQRSRTVGIVDQRLLRGVAIAVTVLCLGLFSVAVWLQVQVWFFALLAIAVSVAQNRPAPAPAGRMFARPPLDLGIEKGIRVLPADMRRRQRERPGEATEPGSSPSSA